MYGSSSGNNWWILILIYGIIMIGMFVGQILLGIAVYHNAKAHCNNSPTMWCVLTVFLGWIAAVIYLATRNSAQNQIIICQQCNTPHSMGLVNCPRCGVHNAYSDSFHNEHTEINRSRSKKFLIASIVLYGVMVLAWIVMAVVVPVVTTVTGTTDMIW